MEDSWTIAIDTREQRPLEFVWPTSPATLATGDYSIIGFEDQVAIERKSLADLVQTLIRHRDRFVKELERFLAIPFRCIIVESDLRKLFAHSYRSQAHPESVLGLALAFMIDYKIPILFCSTRIIAAKVAFSFLKRAQSRIIASGDGNGEHTDV